MSHKHKKKLARILLAALVFLVVFLVVRLNHLGLVAQAFLYAIPFLIAGYDVLKKALVKILPVEVKTKAETARRTKWKIT